VDRKVYYFGERVHSEKAVLLDKGVEMVCIEVVLGSSRDRVVVVLKVPAHNGRKKMAWVIGHTMDVGHKKVIS